jgi:putative addiction module component (TIGR02574 family)
MTQGLLEAAMALPPEERAELADRLWESLPSELADTAFAEDLAHEVRSRRERHLREGSPLHSWTDVRAELDGIIARFDQP